MSDLTTRPGIVVGADDAAAIFAALSSQPGTASGTWRISTTRWELWTHADTAVEPELLAVIEIAHGSPHAQAVTLTRVTLTDEAHRRELTDSGVCNLALSQIGLTVAACARVQAVRPPVFSGQRVTDRAAWSASTPIAPELALSLPTQRGSREMRLDATEDRELRRLHFLASFGGLSGGAAQRYTELRGRDRRRTIRAPHEDDLLTVPRQLAELAEAGNPMVDFSDFVVARFSKAGSA